MSLCALKNAVYALQKALHIWFDTEWVRPHWRKSIQTCPFPHWRNSYMHSKKPYMKSKSLLCTQKSLICTHIWFDTEWARAQWRKLSRALLSVCRAFLSVCKTHLTQKARLQLHRMSASTMAAITNAAALAIDTNRQDAHIPKPYNLNLQI